MSGSDAAPPRDRYLSFAFAGADLLVETGPDGMIRFAAGAFPERLGMAPEAAIGRHLRTLVAPPDRGAMTVALGTVASRGRIAPIVLRLNDAARTPVALAAIAVPSQPPRICVTLGPVPTAADPHAADADDPRLFAREAEARMREGDGGALALLEVANWQLVRERLPGEDQRALRDGIAEAIGAAGLDGSAQEMGDGRYGVLVNGRDEVAGLVQRLDRLVRGSPAAKFARVDGLGLSLGAGALTPSQAARALRYTLSQFRAGGAAAARAVGGGDGLPGVLARAASRTLKLRTAIADGRFQLKYQPVVSLVDGTIHHFEALIRPFAALIGPDQTTQDFVLFVEAMGLTEDLDCAVVDMALAALRVHPEASVAVNVSGLSMQSAGFRDRLLATLDNPGSGGRSVVRRLLLELTETAEIDEMAAAATNIAAFRQLGVPMCLDDFGAGAAAFTYLREFQVDFVKIDGLYVRRAALGVRERGFVSSMVDLAARVSARVIAEQVETDAEAQLMRVLGVEFGQGWLFGRPGMLPGKGR